MLSRDYNKNDKLTSERVNLYPAMRLRQIEATSVTSKSNSVDD